MNLPMLLRRRDTLLQQARLANLAYAYVRLRDFLARIERAGLRGSVAVRAGDPLGSQPWPGLTALNGAQSILEEHFLEEELVELADILAFVDEDASVGGGVLRLADLAHRTLPRLRRELAASGVIFGDDADLDQPPDPKFPG